MVGSEDGSSSTVPSERPNRPVSRQPSIPQSSRLLQPTLSWQAKATYIPETFSYLTTSQLHDNAGFSDRQPDSETQSETSTAAKSSQSLAAPTGRRSAPSWKHRTSRSSDGAQRKQTPSATTVPQLIAGSQDPHELRPEHIVLEPASAIEQQRARLRHVQPNPPPCTNPPVYISPFSNAPVLAGTEAAGSPMPVPSHGYASRAASGRLRAAGAQRAASASMSPQSSGALADTLQQQRARLKPLQTSAKLLASKPPGGETTVDAAKLARTSSRDGGANPITASKRRSGERPAVGSYAALSAASRAAVTQTAEDTPASTTATTLVNSLPSGGHETVQPTTTWLHDANAPISSPPVQPDSSLLDPLRPTLKREYGNLSSLIQNTALQRDMSLSQVPVPVKRSKGQAKTRRSLEEVRASIRSFTQGNLDISPKPVPARRVSTGAITPAFLEEKTRRDTALLASLGFSSEVAEVCEDSAACQSIPSGVYTPALHAAQATDDNRNQMPVSSAQTATGTESTVHAASSAVNTQAGISFSAVSVLGGGDAPPAEAAQPYVDHAAVAVESEQPNSIASTQARSMGQGPPQSRGHQRQPSGDIPTLHKVADRRSSDNAADISGAALPSISEDNTSTADQGEHALQPQSSEESRTVMGSLPSFNAQIRMKWGVQNPDPSLQHSRMAKQSSMGGGAFNSDTAGTAKAEEKIKAIMVEASGGHPQGAGNQEPVPQASVPQSKAATQASTVLSKETSLRISADAIEGPKFDKPLKRNWRSFVVCGCAAKD